VVGSRRLYLLYVLSSTQPESSGVVVEAEAVYVELVAAERPAIEVVAHDETPQLSGSRSRPFFDFLVSDSPTTVALSYFPLPVPKLPR